jgi:hypothetical protein
VGTPHSGPLHNSMPRRLSRHRLPTPEPPSPSIPRPSYLPSAIWPTSHPEYSADVHQLACSINYLSLRNKCSGIRGGKRCVISPKYYLGRNNLVREIVFQDEVVWIALFARLDSTGEFSSQASLMRRLGARVPVPEVYAYSDETGELGGRYLIMEGICGRRAEAEYFMFGIADRCWNSVLGELGRILARGMAVTWASFEVEGTKYTADEEFWIRPARRNIRRMVGEIVRLKQCFAQKAYSKFVTLAKESLFTLFAELLYLCNSFLLERPINISAKFPSHLPPLKMENIIFDDDYQIKGIIGFPRTEAVSTWDYFQYPFCLEDSFDDCSMTRTISWMRESFLEAWQRELVSLDVLPWPDFRQREKWCQNDLTSLLYQFRSSQSPSRELLVQIFSRLYSLDKTITLEILFHAFLFLMCSTLANHAVAWEGSPDVYVEMFLHLIKLDTGQVKLLAERGLVIESESHDGNKFPSSIS